ncbi:DoxX family protein [Kaistella polysaccharea]|uniref:DoxX family protein n=1 Tax=Kaistella polysaccharea TaxID=2878534 RepID=UPI001CF53780|nr:hypothetical protein [Kaistella polysaccharea]
MKLLSIIAVTFVLSLGITKIIEGNWNFLFSGNLALAVFIIFTGLAHFKYQKGMALMIPDIFPVKMFLVYLTGILEIAAGIGLLFPAWRVTTAILLIIFLILVFFANINSSRKNVNLFKGDFSGPGMDYLYKERLPMQIILIVWTWFFGIYLPSL